MSAPELRPDGLYVRVKCLETEKDWTHSSNSNRRKLNLVNSPSLRKRQALSSLKVHRDFTKRSLLVVRVAHSASLKGEIRMKRLCAIALVVVTLLEFESWVPPSELR